MLNDIIELDQLLRRAFPLFVADIQKAQWQGKERDCVHRFAMGYLVDACGEHSLLKHPTQIGIEMAVAKPPRVGIRRTAPKDLVIWPQPWPTVWGKKWKHSLRPLAVIEWKASRGKFGSRNATHDQKWLRSFAKANPESVGYSVVVQFGAGEDHCRVRIARFQQATHDRDWLSV